MANKFPIAYHEGNSEQYKNVKYNIYTEANVHKYTSDEASPKIDFYVFNETAADDSPQQAFILLLIKNVGSANSQLSIDEISIETALSGAYQPFSIVSSTSEIGSVGQTGLSVMQHSDFNTNMQNNDANYVALNPAPIAYVRVKGAEVSVNDDGSSFGTAGDETFIPFYSPDAITTVENKIGNTSFDYGSGSQEYPHYAGLLLRCDPSIPLEIGPGEVVLNITQSTGTEVNIDLVMQSYNESIAGFQQGYIRLDFDTNLYSFVAHPDFTTSSVVPTGEDANNPNFDNISGLGSNVYSADNVIQPTITNPLQAFYLGYYPDGFKYSQNNSLFGSSSSHQFSSQVPVVKVFDASTTTGGLNFHSSYDDNDGSLQSDLGLALPAGFKYGTFTSQEQPGFYFIKKTANTFSYFFGAGITPDIVNANDRLELAAGEVLYLIPNINNFLLPVAANSCIKDHNIAFENLPFMQHLRKDGTAAWEANVMAIPFFHKTFYINATNNSQTKYNIIHIVNADYNPLSMHSHHSSLVLGHTYIAQDGTWVLDGENQKLQDYGKPANTSDVIARGSYNQINLYTNVDSYYRGALSSSISDVTLDVNTTSSIQTTFSASNGTFIPSTTGINKHLHIKDFLRMPNVEAGNNETSDSTILPAISWQVFQDTQDSNNVFYAREFPWNPTEYTTEYEVFNGNETSTLPIITNQRLANPSIEMTMPISEFYFQPLGVHEVDSADNATQITFNDSHDTAISTSKTLLSSSSAGIGFQNVSLANKVMKQKVLKLATQVVAGTMTPNHGFQQDNSSTELYKEMNWGVGSGGDQIGRYFLSHAFEIDPNVMLKASDPAIAGSNSLIDQNKSHRGALKKLKFLMWAWVFPRYEKTLSLVNKGVVLLTPYYTTYGAGMDIVYGGNSTITSGGAVTTEHLNALSQKLNITNYNGRSRITYSYTNENGAYGHRRYPFNGDSVFKFENVFADNYDRTLTIGGATSDIGKYGILPGPRKVGRFSSGSMEPAWHQNNKFVSRQLSLNAEAGRYEAFVKLDFVIENENSNYEVQIVNMFLDNEMIPTSGGVPVFADPAKEYDIPNQTHSSDDFEVPISDENFCPPTAPASQFVLYKTTLATATTTITIADITRGGRTLDTQTNKVNYGQNATQAGIMVGQSVTSSTASALQGGRVVVGISGSYIFLSDVPNQNATAQTLTFTTNADAVGIKVGQKVSLTSFIAANTTITQTQANTFTLSANPTANGTNKMLNIEWANRDYGSWCMVHGKRDVGESAGISVISRTPSKPESYYKYAPVFVQPYQFNKTVEEWDDETWDGTNRYVGALKFNSAGMLKVNVGSQISTYATAPPATFLYSAIDTWVKSMGGSATSRTTGYPHIYLGIDRTKIEANNIDNAVFYNRFRVRYILHNKLENYGPNQRLITGNQFTSNDRGHSFQTGAGQQAHVYESVYLVKMTLRAATPTLVITDAEGDAATPNHTIDFGTIHSS
tara:strand:- start:4788 stop:9218 length:4431 start_codon:yes stop_codon:yes gene_type:complete